MSLTLEYQDYESLQGDPVWVMEHMLGVTLYGEQREIVRAVWGITTTKRRVAVKAAHAVGKSFLASCCAVAWLMMHDKAVVLSTAPTHRQVEDVLWREIRARWRDSIYDLSIKPPNNTDWELDPDRFARGFATDKGDKFQGYHSPNVLILVDEASGVGDGIFEAIEGILLGGANVHILLIGNPVSDNGEFYDAFYGDAAEIYEQFTLDVYKTPLFTGEMPEVDWKSMGLVNPVAVAELLKKYKNHPNVIAVRIQGEFPDTMEDQVITAAMIRQMYETRRPHGVRIGALDVGGSGDRCAFGMMDGQCIEYVEDRAGLTNPQLVNWALQLIAEFKLTKLVIDANGIGWGAYGDLVQENAPVVPFLAQAKARDQKRFFNRASEGWWMLREMAQEFNISLSPDITIKRELEKELKGAIYEFVPRPPYDLIRVDKDGLTGKSPNLADTIIMMIAEMVRGTPMLHRTSGSGMNVRQWAGSSKGKKRNLADERIVERRGVRVIGGAGKPSELEEWSLERV